MFYFYNAVGEDDLPSFLKGVINFLSNKYKILDKKILNKNLFFFKKKFGFLKGRIFLVKNNTIALELVQMNDDKKFAKEVFFQKGDSIIILNFNVIKLNQKNNLIIKILNNGKIINLLLDFKIINIENELQKKFFSFVKRI